MVPPWLRSDDDFVVDIEIMDTENYLELIVFGDLLAVRKILTEAAKGNRFFLLGTWD